MRMWRRVTGVILAAAMMVPGGVLAQTGVNADAPEWTIKLGPSSRGPGWVKISVNEKGEILLSGGGTLLVQGVPAPGVEPATAGGQGAGSAVALDMGAAAGAAVVGAAAGAVAAGAAPAVSAAAETNEAAATVPAATVAAVPAAVAEVPTEAETNDAAVAAAVAAAGTAAGVAAVGEDELVRDGLTEERSERGNWRISVGASLIGAVGTNIRANHARMRELSGFGETLIESAAARHGWRHRAEAYAAGSGGAYGGVRRFDDGAWFDPIDSGTPNDPNYTWNWRLHDPSEQDIVNHGKAFVERNAYDEIHEYASVGEGSLYRCWNSDESSWYPGVRAELAYELYRSEDKRPWGVDLAAAFSYYFRRDLWKAGGEAGTASVSGREETGYFEWWNDSHDEAQYVLDYYRDTQFDGSMWGAGTFAGPGAELAVDSWQVRDVMTGAADWSSGHSLRYFGYGDYQEYAIEILMRPWWEPWDWFRIFGTVGLEISRREFDWQMLVWGTEGAQCRDCGTEDEWRIFGLLGGGLSFQWRDFVLAGEALWRFCGDDMDVYGRTIRGSIEHATWGFQLSLGYEF